MNLLRSLAPLLGLALLTACSGTPEEAAPVRLVVQEGTGPGATLRVIDPGRPDPTTGALAPGESAPISLGTAGTDQIIGVQTLAGVNRLAVVFQNRVEIYGLDGSNLGLQKLSTLPTPQRTSDGAQLQACYIQVRGEETRTRLVLLSACTSQVQPQQVVVLDTSSSDPTASWWRDLPSGNPDATTNRIALSGGVVTVARPNPSTGSDVFRGGRDDTPGVTLPQRYTAPLINDLANYRGIVYAATDDTSQGVRPVNDGSLGAAFLIPRANSLFPDGEVLTSWNNVPQLVFARGTANNGANPQYAFDVRGAAVPPDGYAYVLSSGSITRYDVLVGLSAPTASFSPLTLSLPTALNNAQDIAWLVPQ